MESKSVCYFKSQIVNDNVSWKEQFFGMVTYQNSPDLPRFFEINPTNKTRRALLNENLFSADEKEEVNVLQENLGIELHNEEGPAVIKSDGETHFYQNGKLSAIEYPDIGKNFFQNGMISRFEDINGDKEFYHDGSRCIYEYANGDQFISEENEFNIERSNGDKEFYNHGKLIRIEFSNGNEPFYYKSYLNDNFTYLYDRKNSRGKWVISNRIILIIIEFFLFYFMNVILRHFFPEVSECLKSFSPF